MTLVGIAYGSYVPQIVQAHPAKLDFVEVPFELLSHNPEVARELANHRVILHCASLNIGGPVRPPPSLIRSLRKWIASTQTPWLGEHLAFTTASAGEQSETGESPANEPYNLGFTLSPPMNSATVKSVVSVVQRYGSELGVPIILENSPLYFAIPGSSMSQVDFISEVCRRSSARLLLDLTHFLITSRNMDFDPFRELERYPFESVDEIHISGASEQSDVWWDDHASPASDEVFELLDFVLKRAKPRAVTLEYNWSAKFPLDIAMHDLDRIREASNRCA